MSHGTDLRNGCTRFEPPGGRVRILPRPRVAGGKPANRRDRHRSNPAAEEDRREASYVHSGAGTNAGATRTGSAAISANVLPKQEDGSSTVAAFADRSVRGD